MPFNQLGLFYAVLSGAHFRPSFHSYVAYLMILIALYALLWLVDASSTLFWTTTTVR